jgi:hypothetical protein
VASQLSFDQVGACASTKLEQLAQDLNFTPCAENYTIDQMQVLQTVAFDSFSFQCVGDMLKSACGTYLDQTYLESIRASLTTTLG